MKSARSGLAALAFITTAIACGDYARTNPYDASVDVSIAVSGPDTLFSLNEQAHFSALITPVFPDTAVEWASSDTFALTPAGSGDYKSSVPPLYPATRTAYVSALIGHLDTVKTVTIGAAPVSFPDITWRHKGIKFVVMTQRVTRVQLRCPDAHACDTLSIGATWSVWVDAFDALNHQIFSITSSTANPTSGDTIVSYIVRDPTIASAAPVGIRAATVTARKSGTTWIVGTRGPAIDSLRLVVR